MVWSDILHYNCLPGQCVRTLSTMQHCRLNVPAPPWQSGTAMAPNVDTMLETMTHILHMVHVRVPQCLCCAE